MTYNQPCKHGLKESIILCQELEDFFVGGDVDEYGEGILGYGLYSRNHSCINNLPSHVL